jgi:Fic family protein
MPKQREDLKKRIGTYILSKTADEPFKAYCPKSLPPDPAIDLNALSLAIDAAHYALGLLDGASLYLANVDVFLYSYVRKEALFSSQIEGTQSTLTDILLFESQEQPSVPLDDVEEVCNYVAAMKYGISRLEKLPMSLRLIKELHVILLKGTRGKTKEPGEFRRTQNWIGGSRPSKAIFVPPPPHKLKDCLDALEKFIHKKNGLPTLVKIALIHVQFETIHPFLDGNGRLGRLLITLLLIDGQLQKKPLLYLSLYLKNNRETYYHLLQKVRTEGAWEEWLLFFLNAVIETSTQAVETILDGAEMFKSDVSAIKALGVRKAETPLLVHQYMQERIITTVRKAANDLKLTNMTITKALMNLSELNIIREVTGKSRGRIFVYEKYFRLLDKGTEPLLK